MSTKAGKTTKPLRVLVHPLLLELPEVKALGERGHHVTTAASLEDYHLILGPNAWRMTPVLIKYLDMAIKAARKEHRK